MSPHVNCLKVGEEINLKVTLLNVECNKFIEQERAGKVISLDRHRFKVECAPISAAKYEEILSKKPEDQLRLLGDFIKNLGNGEKVALKYRVTYTYPAHPPAIAPRDASKTNGNGSQTEREKGASKWGGGAGRAEEYTGPGLDPNSIDVVLSELQAVRTKYDKACEYWVNLQAEQETLSARLDAKMAERKEAMQKKDRERKGAKLAANARKKGAVFSEKFVLGAFLLFYVLGYYLEQKKLFSYGSVAGKLEL